MSLATGCRSSSASCPISPAARASRAKPRSSSSGSPRSARAAPQTPAPFNGRVRPSTCGWTRPIAVKRARCGPRRPSSAARASSRGCAGRRPCARGGRAPGRTGRSPAGPVRSPAPPRPSRLSSVGSPPSRPVSTSCRKYAVLGDAEEAGAAAEEPGREGALHRVGRGEVGQPGHHRGGGEAVVGEGGEHGLEDAGLAGGRPPLGGQPEGQFAESDLAHDLAGQVVAEQSDRLAGGGAEGRGVDGGAGCTGDAGGAGGAGRSSAIAVLLGSR